MATRSTIAVLRQNGSVAVIYCHFDGYLDYNGRVLLENYGSTELAEALISGGDCSQIRGDIESTVFYSRDRGESVEDTCAIVYSSLAEYYDRCESQEYNYIMKNGQWWVHHHGAPDAELVSDALASLDD